VAQLRQHAVRHPAQTTNTMGHRNAHDLEQSEQQRWQGEMDGSEWTTTHDGWLRDC
jgi:hypothetical protein